MERRHFFKKVLSWVFYIAGTALVAYPALSFITFKRTREKKVTFSQQDTQADTLFKEGIYLVNEDGRRRALSGRCTHLGCFLNYDQLSETFRCPCHGSIFDRKGRRISGPAKIDLTEIPTSEMKNGDLLVTLKQ